MKRVEALCSINSGKYDKGRTYVVSEEEATALVSAGLARVVREEVIDMRPATESVQTELDSIVKGKKKRRQ